MGLGKPIELTSTEFSLLELLAPSGQARSEDEIYVKVLGRQMGPRPRDRRARLGRAPQDRRRPRQDRSDRGIRGVGYQPRPPPFKPPDPPSTAMRWRFPINSFFWRIFAGLLTVIIATGVFVWIYSWVVQSREEGGHDRLAPQRPEGRGGALIVHRYGGREQLERWLQPRQQRPDRLRAGPQRGGTLGAQVPEPAIEMLADLRQGHLPPQAMGMHGRMRNRSIHGNRDRWPPHRLRHAHGPEARAHRPCPSTRATRRTSPSRRGSSSRCSSRTSWPSTHAAAPALGRAMQRFAQGELSTRVSGDIGTTDRENRLARGGIRPDGQRIGQLVNRQRRLFHDVSHG